MTRYFNEKLAVTSFIFILERMVDQKTKAVSNVTYRKNLGEDGVIIE